mgnify:CR=1 FL=1
MTSVMGMVKLDFLTVKSQSKLFLILAAITAYFAMMGSSFPILCATCSWFAVLMAANVFISQEKNGLERLYSTLSLRPGGVVLGRYLFMLCTHLFSLAVLVVFYCGIGLIRHMALDLQEIVFGFCLSLLFFCLIEGIQLPLFFKMGYAKAKLWSLLPFIAVMGLLALPVFSDAFQNVAEFMEDSRGTFSALCLLASALVLLVSYACSVAAYRKKR